MLKKIEKLIPAALDAIDENLAKHEDYKEKGIPSAYQSAISGFGTSILQMGLLPTLAVYYDTDNQSGITRKLLLDVLYAIILDNSVERSEALESALVQRNDSGNFLRTVSSSAEVKNEFKPKLMDAALAFKLAIRTYNLVKS